METKKASPVPNTSIHDLPVAIYTCDKEGRITSYNKAAEILWGGSPVVDKDYWYDSFKIFQVDGKLLAKEQYPMAIALREARPVHSVALIVERPDGSRRYIKPYASPVFDSKGIVSGGVNMIEDVTEAKWNEESIGHLASIVAFSDDAIVSKSLDGTIRSWNKSAEKMFGYSEKFAVGKNISLIIPKEYINEESDIIEKITNDQVIEHYETIRVKKGGERFPVSVTVSPLKDKSGKIIGASKIARDITAAKKNEESVAHLASIVAFSDDAIVSKSLDGTIQSWNKSAEKMFGYTAKFAIGKNISLIIPKEYVHEESDIIEKISNDEVIEHYETIRVKKGGERFHVSVTVSPLKDKSGKIIGISKIARDITTEKLISQYTRSLIEASKDPLVTISVKGKILDMNNAMMAAVGKTREQLTGTDFSIYFTEPEKAKKIYSEVFKKGFVTDYPLTMKDGELTDVLFNGSGYKDEKGNVLGAVVVARDISEQKRIEKELIEAKVFAELATEIAEDAKRKAEDATRQAKEATKTAEEAVRSKQQFLSNMSHEIRTPMNAIIGFTKVVLKTELTVKQKEYLTAIKTSGDALIVLINDILDLAKVDAGKMTFEHTPFKLVLSISAMLHLFETKVQEKNLRLIKVYDNRIPEVLVGDAVRLHQIILNLVSNAVKFTTEGQITVKVDLLKEDEDSATIQFSVTDTGIGIAANKIETIFENFQQASSGTARLYGGTGLGLAIVKQLVEAQAGSINVVSEINEGSTFSFILSFQKTKAAAELIDELVELDNEIKNIKVLVVEDIALNQLLMKTLLDDFGFEREIAGNGKIAIEKMRTKTYDIVLMDLQMPEMNGFEATDYIRNTMHSKIPIIALTADVTTVDLAKCKAVGMNDYIAKPVDDRLLYSKIIGLVKKPVQVKTNGENRTMSAVDSEHGTKIKYTDLHYLIQRTKSNQELMKEMISLYLEQTPPLIVVMKQSMENKDWASVYSAVHKMIPSFSIMGISRDFEDMAKKVQEYASTQQQTDRIPTLVLQLETVCGQACKELEEELNTIKNTTK